MNNSLLDDPSTRAHSTSEPPRQEGTVSPIGNDIADRPNDIPEKFWDSEKNEIRMDALLQSYQELERRAGGAQPLTEIPSNPEDYKLQIKNDVLDVDTDINTRLHQAGFTNSQAQLVYDLAAERLIPMVTEVASMFEAESQVERLVERFGGPDAWRETARQISTWGQASLPREVFEALSTTSEGVLAMHQMMQAGEPSLVREGSSPRTALSEADLKTLMRDPRYWRDQDPRIIEQVRQGFKALFPE